MSDETPDIEILPPEELDATPPRKSGLGYPVFLAGLIVASLLGALGGGAAAYYLRQPAANVAPIQQNVSALQTRLTKLERSQSQTALAINGQPDVSGEMDDLSSRITALENAPPVEFNLPDLDADALAELKAAQDAGFSWPDSSGVKAELAALQSRIDTLEASIDNRPKSTAQSQTTLPTSPPFPKAAILAALEKQTQSTGFLDRTLNKHIRVKDNNDPLVLIEAIEAALTRGDIRTAREKFDRLPSPARSAGQDWRNSLN